MENRVRMQNQLPHDLNHFLTGVPALFPILENVGSFSVDTANVLSTRISEDDELVCCYGISEKAVALTFGASLLLANRENAQHDQKTSVESDSSLHSTSEFASVQAEIEFEHALSSIAWDTLGNCLAVYDSGGTVHLLKRDGSIAFSKKILPDPELAMFLFVTLDASLQALFSLTTSGQLLCVGNMDTAALCGGSGDEKIQALKSLQLLKWTVCSKEAAAVSKASLLSVGSEGALDMLLAVVDMDGKLTLKELVADGSSTVNDLGYPHGLDGKQVVDIRSLCGKICLLLTSDGTLCALSCQFGRVPQVLQTFYIGDSSLAFKYVDCVDSSVNQTAGFLVAVESKWKIYSFTVLVDTDMDMGYIIPHGYVSSPKQAQGSVKYAARSQHSAYANCQGLCLQSSGQPGLAVVSVQQFSRVSNMLARDIYRSAASAPILDQLHFIIAEGRPLPFGVLLGHIVGCVVRLEEGEVDAVKVEAVLSRILDQRFASEVLLAGHAFWPLLQREFDIKQLFSRLQAAISSPKISKEGVTESHSIVSRLLHHSRLCTSLFSFSPCLLLGSENECATPTYDDAVERLHSVLPSRIGVTVSILLTRGYSHYRDIVLLFQHQVVTTSYPPIIVDGNNAAYATHTTNSWTHSLKQASVSQFFAGVDPCFIVDVPSFLSVCSFVLEAYKQISQGRGEASDDDSAGCEVAVELCKTLYAFVKVMAGDLSKESACKMIIQHALCVLQQLPVCYQPHLLGDLRLDLQSLNEHLILQSALHKVMKVHVSIEDIQSVGWRGFIFEQLEAFHIVVEGGTALCDDVLSVFISNQLAVLTEKFKVDLDVILSEFIVSTFDQLLSEMAIQEEGGQNSPIHEYHATLAKLLVVFKNIRNSALFGYTCLVKMFAFYSYLHNNETIPLHKAAMVALCENFCDTMISALAEAFIAVSKGKERDEVTEALRLYRLRLMARKYAIQDIDLRDNHQLLAAMSIITNHGTSNGDNSVAAGMQFAVQDGNVRVEIASALSRRLVSFASHTSHDDLAYDQKLHGFLTSVPVKSIHSVLEDVLDCLRAEHDDICSQLKLIGKSKLDNSEIHELKVFVDNIAKGIVKLSEAYCDGDYSAHGSLHLLSWRGRDVKNKSTSQLQHTTHRDIFKVMSNYRKLYHLQTAHQIYMLNSDLGSRDTCQGFVRDMVLASVDRFLLSFDQNSKQSSSSACYSLQELSSATDASLLIGDYMHTEIPRLSKVAHLLGVGLAKVVLIVTRRMVEKGKKALAFWFANNYLDATKEQEKNFSVDENASALKAVSGNQDEYITYLEEDWQALVDVVKLLSSASLKKTSSSSSYGSSYYDTAAADTILDEFSDAQVKRIHALSRQTLSRAAVCAPSKVLQKSIELLSMQDLLSLTYSQLEEAKTKQDSSRQATVKSLLHQEDNVLEHDGLLLSQNQTLPLLAHYVLSETRRREYFLSMPIGKLPVTQDMFELVTYLQRSEKHLMAMKILYSTWQSSVEVVTLSKMIRASAFPLCHKVLHYRTLDNSFALACLSSLPLEVTIKELKAAVPSTLSTDFYRLQAIATLGEEMATLHENDSMLLLFQRLTNHAKWWGILSNTLHINVDVKLFQHADYEMQTRYIKSLVTSIVFMSKGNLEMASEYCQVFDIEPEVSLLAYIEYMLTSSAGHENWEYKVKQAALGLKEEDLVRELSTILFKLSGTDYERIIYVCQWLIALLSDADDNSHNAEFLTKYKNYLDVSKYLTNLDVPVSVFDALHGGRLPEETSSRKGEHSNHRLSFWLLVNHTLDFIDVLCSVSVTWTLDKIAPLVRYINITMEDFYLSLICGHYPSLRPELASKGIDAASSSVCADIVSKVEERMSTYLLLAPQHFIRVYMFISEFEERSNSPASYAREMRIFVLKKTVAIMEKAEIESWVLMRGDGKQERSYSKNNLGIVLLSLEVESIVTAFEQSLTREKVSQDCWWGQVPYVGETGQINILLIAERLMELCLEACWEEHTSLHALAGVCKSMSLYTMLTNHSISGAVLDMLATTAKFVLKVISLFPSTTAQSLETVMLTMIYKLLADSSGPLSSAQDAQPSGALLKADSLHHLLPSPIENQQADVVFTGFGLFAVLTICEQIRSSGVTALTIHDSVWAEFVKVALEDKQSVLGFRNISARRFNARCRCKVSLALALLMKNQGRESLIKIRYVESRDVQRHVSYYCLLASMHETRNITYSEESFYMAFHSYDHTTLRSILLTWIYCEGGDSRPDSVSSLVDILALSVDLYVLASLFEVTAIALLTELLERLVVNKGSERLVHRLLAYMWHHQPYAFNQAVYQCPPQSQPVFTKAAAGLVANMHSLSDRLYKDLLGSVDGQCGRNTDNGIFTRPSESTKSAPNCQKLLRHVDNVMFGPLVSSDVALTAYQTAVTWESLLSLLSCLNLHSPLGVLACDGGGLQENTSAALRAHVETVVVQALRKVRLDVSAATGRNIVSLIRVMLSSQVLAMCALYHAAALDAMLLECWLLVAAVHTVAPVVARGDVVAYLMQLLAAASARPEISAAGLEASVSAAALRALAALPMESATTFVTVVLQYLLVETAVPTPAISAGEGGDGMADERARAFCTRCLYQALQDVETPLSTALKDFVRRQLSETQRKKIFSAVRQ